MYVGLHYFVKLKMLIAHMLATIGDACFVHLLSQYFHTL